MSISQKPTAVAVIVVSSLMLLAVAACEKKDAGREAAASQTRTTSASTGAASASCDMVSALGTCNEYRNGTTYGLEKSLCQRFHGKFSSAGCSTGGQIGSCLMSDGEVKRYYGSGVAGDHALSVSEAKEDCESEVMKGSFSASPSAT
jgi:hypothetical protein